MWKVIVSIVIGVIVGAVVHLIAITIFDSFPCTAAADVCEDTKSRLNLVVFTVDAIGGVGTFAALLNRFGTC